jgi:hypothetical protein
MPTLNETSEIHTTRETVVYVPDLIVITPEGRQRADQLRSSDEGQLLTLLESMSDLSPEGVHVEALRNSLMYYSILDLQEAIKHDEERATRLEWLRTSVQEELLDTNPHCEDKTVKISLLSYSVRDLSRNIDGLIAELWSSSIQKTRIRCRCFIADSIAAGWIAGI